MNPNAALKRLVEDEDAPCGARVTALRQLAHPPLCLLRRLLVKTSRTKPVPSRLVAVATLAYAREVQLRKIKAARPTVASNDHGNALGI